MAHVEMLIQKFDLKRHPEGGYFAETYRSEALCRPKSAMGSSRNLSTAIYYLLPHGAQSSLHRLKSDETWHFYMGGPMYLHFFYENGNYERLTLGTDIAHGELPQIVIPAGTWFGGYPVESADYSFVGCTVTPGFDFEDFEFADREALCRRHPRQEELIRRLTAEPE